MASTSTATLGGFEGPFFNPQPGFEHSTAHVMESFALSELFGFIMPSSSTWVPEEQFLDEFSENEHRFKRKRADDGNVTLELDTSRRSSTRNKVLDQIAQMDHGHLRLILASWLHILFPDCNWSPAEMPLWWPANVPFQAPASLSLDHLPALAIATMSERPLHHKNLPITEWVQSLQASAERALAIGVYSGQPAPDLRIDHTLRRVLPAILTAFQQSVDNSRTAGSTQEFQGTIKSSKWADVDSRFCQASGPDDTLPSQLLPPEGTEPHSIGRNRTPIGRIVSADGHEAFFYDPLPGFEYLTRHVLLSRAQDLPTTKMASDGTISHLLDDPAAVALQQKKGTDAQVDGSGPTVPDHSPRGQVAKRKRSQSSILSQGSQSNDVDSQEQERQIAFRLAGLNPSLVKVMLRTWCSKLATQRNNSPPPYWWPKHLPFPAPIDKRPLELYSLTASILYACPDAKLLNDLEEWSREGMLQEGQGQYVTGLPVQVAYYHILPEVFNAVRRSGAQNVRSSVSPSKDLHEEVYAQGGSTDPASHTLGVQSDTGSTTVSDCDTEPDATTLHKPSRYLCNRVQIGHYGSLPVNNFIDKRLHY